MKQNRTARFSVLKTFLYGLCMTALAASAAILILWPIWYMATRYTRLYTFVIIGLILAAVAAMFVAKRKKRSARTKPQSP